MFDYVSSKKVVEFDLAVVYNSTDTLLLDSWHSGEMSSAAGIKSSSCEENAYVHS
jgi:hypothetical protein